MKAACVYLTLDLRSTEDEGLLPSKHFLFFKTSWRRLEEFFSVTIFHLPRHLQEVFARPLPKTSSRRLQNVFARSLQDVFKTSTKTSSRRLQDVFKKTFCNCVFKTSSKDKKMLRWRRLQDVFKTSSVRLHQDECLLGYSYFFIEC